MLKQSTYIDFLNGNILINMIMFAVPLMLTSIIQLLFNAADLMVVGRFGSDTAMAAVSSTSSIIHLIVNLFVGLSVGTNVVVARAVGANDFNRASKGVHTAISLALIGGIISAILGLFISAPVLKLMDTPDDVLGQAIIYTKIYLLGAPGSLLYNFGSSVLRSIGDSKRPMYIMTLSGVINILLNLILVIVFHLDAAGVAIATTVSNYVAGCLVLLSLTRLDGMCKLDVSKIKLHKESAIDIIKIGMPSGLQSCLFSISNILIQSSINSFGSTVMSGNAVSQNIESFESISLNAAAQASMTFTSQNLGAKNSKRIRPIFYNALTLSFLIWLVVGGVIFVARLPIMSLYSDSPEVIRFALIRFMIMVPGYLIASFMDASTCTLRGLGCSIPPMVVTVLGVCGFRILWIFTVFKYTNSLKSIYYSYPISWAITFLINAILYFIISKKIIDKLKSQDAGENHE